MRFLIAALILILPVSWSIGAGNCGFRELVSLFSGVSLPESVRTILLDIRLPRLIAAFFVGGMLAAAGSAAQNLFRNDLASPHVLGVVNAAALGAVFGLFIGGWAVTVFAVVFGFSALFLLFWPGIFREWDGATLILAGIAVNAFCSALTSGALYVADERLSSLVFWLLGGFWRITWKEVALLVPVACSGWLILRFLAPEMDMLLLGDRNAALSGVRLGRTKMLAMTAIAALTAVAVSCCGVIGFVGLAVPHMVRLFCGARFRSLLPNSILTGGILLLLADLPARTLFAPHEIPVGVLTALGGAPFFFYLLLRRGRGRL